MSLMCHVAFPSSRELNKKTPPLALWASDDFVGVIRRLQVMGKNRAVGPKDVSGRLNSPDAKVKSDWTSVVFTWASRFVMPPRRRWVMHR